MLLKIQRIKTSASNLEKSINNFPPVSDVKFRTVPKYPWSLSFSPRTIRRSSSAINKTINLEKCLDYSFSSALEDSISFSRSHRPQMWPRQKMFPFLESTNVSFESLRTLLLLLSFPTKSNCWAGNGWLLSINLSLSDFYNLLRPFLYSVFLQL